MVLTYYTCCIACVGALGHGVCMGSGHNVKRVEGQPVARASAALPFHLSLQPGLLHACMHAAAAGQQGASAVASHRVQSTGCHVAGAVLPLQHPCHSCDTQTQAQSDCRVVLPPHVGRWCKQQAVVVRCGHSL